MVGQKVSHFEIVEELGRGGMGVVYKGKDTRLHRFVALKFLADSLAGDTVSRTRFLQEARAAAALEHVNVCSIFEIGDSATGIPYIVMGFCDGRSLREILAERQLEMDEVRSIARQIASGMAHAHRNHVVHRDLKPGNVMIVGDGVVKIVDFGIANLGSTTTLTGDTIGSGTPAYMAPEQVQGASSDRRSDIWSFGVLLYEMLTGRNPFLANYDQASIYNVLNSDPPLVRTSRPDASADWDALIRKCLEKDPSQRPGSFDAVLDALPGLEPSKRTAREKALFTGYLPKTGSRAYVGRVDERAWIFDRLSVGHGSTTLVFGESGIGKTQFVSRIVAEKLTEGGHALWGRCLFNEGALPYHPFVSALKKGFPPGTDVVEAIDGLALTGEVDFRGRRAHLQSFLSVSEDTEQVLNREQLWHTMLLVYTVLSSPEEPLYMIVDDLQWADAATVALFCYLARSVEATNVHLIGLYRLEGQSRRGSAEDVLVESLRQLRIDGLADQIDLTRFDKDDSYALVERILDGDPVDESLKAHVFEQSEGLPLFLAESLNLLRIEGRISKIDGVWCLPDGEEESTRVSGRIQDIILQRLDALEDQDRELLEVAAIVGELFTSEALEACLGWPRIRVLKRLQLIEKKHQLVMHETEGYRFDHTMVRQVLYDGILPELRREYHRLIAAELEERHAVDDDYAAAIAVHLVESGQEPAAIPFLLRAADRARAVRASEQALDAYEMLEDIRKRLRPDDTALAMATAKGLGDVLYALGDVPRATERFNVFLDLARSAGNAKSELEARRKLADCLRVTGRLDEALDLIERALQRAREEEIQEEILKTLHTCAEVWASRGSYQKSAECAQEALQLAADNEDRANQSIAESILGFAYWHMGSLQLSQEHFSRALATQRAIGDRLGMATTLNFLALSLWKLGRFEEAISCARESVDVKRRISLLRAVPGSLNIIGDVYRDAFALDDAIRVHEESLELATAHDNKGGMCDNLRDLGADYLEKGDYERAEEYMRRALALAESSGIKWYETRSSIGLAETLARAGDMPQARRFADRGLELAEQIKARELLIEAYWAKAAVLGDDPQKRRELLEDALKAADELELKSLAWRIRVDLAALCETEGLRDDAARLRSEAAKIIVTITDGIGDTELRTGFLASDVVARTLAG